MSSSFPVTRILRDKLDKELYLLNSISIIEIIDILKEIVNKFQEEFSDDIEKCEIINCHNCFFAVKLYHKKEKPFWTDNKTELIQYYYPSGDFGITIEKYKYDYPIRNLIVTIDSNNIIEYSEKYKNEICDYKLSKLDEIWIINNDQFNRMSGREYLLIIRNGYVDFSQCLKIN